jgi:DNA polymerase-3 subunit alpha (Gram-positive type)
MKVILNDIIPLLEGQCGNYFVERVAFYKKKRNILIRLDGSDEVSELDRETIKQAAEAYFSGFQAQIEVAEREDLPEAPNAGLSLAEDDTPPWEELPEEAQEQTVCEAEEAPVEEAQQESLEETEDPAKEEVTTGGDDYFLKKKEMILQNLASQAQVSQAKSAPAASAPQDDGVIYGKKFKDEPIPLSELTLESDLCCVEGEVFFLETRELRSGKTLFTIYITDNKTSVSMKVFCDKNKTEQMNEALKKGMYIRAKGRVTFDTFAKENVFMANSIIQAKKEQKMDNAPKKRVELHAHTVMSNMDAVVPAAALVKTAARWGHPAVAITDHGVVQSFPDAMKAAKGTGIKVIYGVEGYLVDDEQAGCVFGIHESKTIAESEFVVFDLETTGLNPKICNITEIGAVKIKSGKIVDTWSSFVNPEMPIPAKITELTGITDDMVKDAPVVGEALKGFFEFSKGCILVAHNTSFDCNFIRVLCGRLPLGLEFRYPYLDTLAVARSLYPNLKNHKLDTLTRHLKIVLDNHHRAVDDAMATAKMFLAMAEELKNRGITDLNEINKNLVSKEAIIKQPRRHVILLVRTQAGMKNLYKLVSFSHLDYYYRKPILPKSLIEQYRDGIIIGSACEQGELYAAVEGGAEEEEIDRIASFYDYFEIQPLGNNQFKIEDGTVQNRRELEEINIRIIELGRKYNKLVVGTCDVHFLNPEDEIYRRILMAGQGFSDADKQAPLYFRTTEEMLAEFSYLDDALAQEIVVENTNKIADMIEDGITPISPEKCTPVMENCEQDIQNMTMNKAKSIYGDPLPPIVAERLDKELNSIIKNGFSVMYLIAQKLVKKSLDDGYLVGSRGSVGSSLVAFMTDITEVNSLAAHYVCPNCKHSEFPENTNGISGCDLPNRDCPVCGTKMKKDGHDIPFETFLGFEGDKEPDIDLNFSGDYQPVAHKYTEELFGQGQVFRAGTIGTIAEKTAYGFIKNYFEEKGVTVSKAEMERLVQGCTGVRRTTGQHPGGIVVVPHGHEIYEFCPVQHPADDTGTDIVTTHFDYHSIDKNLLKLDILGHDDPTVIRMLEDLTGIDAKTIEIGEEKTMSLFTTPAALGVTEEEIDSPTGTYGVPEFGTNFVRQMLVDTKPKTFSELIRISGLSHGTDVWTGNAQELIRNHVTNLSGAICTRDDIMLYLISMHLDPKHAFFIMEAVRKGKGLKPEDEEEMRAHDVPEWYIESCNKIQYMFPKAHAVAYVTMAFRIAWFKVYYPKEYYTTYFSIRAGDFDYELMCQGREKVLQTMKELDQKKEQEKLSAKENGMYTVLQMCNEMYCRKIRFLPIDLYESDATKFMVREDGILPPLNSISGLGDNAAQSICEERKKKEFFSKDEILERTKLTKTNLEVLERCGCLNGMSQSSQMSLF